MKAISPLLGTLLAGAMLTFAPTPAPAAEAKQAVLKANDGFYAALNQMFTGDAAPMLAVWSHAADVTYLSPDGRYLTGWDAVKADWEMQAKLKLGGEIKPRDVRALVGRELAVVQNWEEGGNTNAGGRAVEVKIRATNVYRLEDGQWKMVSHHADPLPFLQKDD
ncbi:MAG: nuclear transport factor 2 family protein [Verrucomicrobiota bacterium]